METIRSEAFAVWLKNLRDPVAKIAILRRLGHIDRGLLGDVRPVGEGVMEARIHQGAGYQVYFIQHGATVIIILCGGDKSSQDKDIAKAKAMAREWRQ